MSLLDCIANAEKEGTLTGPQASRARQMFSEFKAENRARQMGPAEADAQAGRDTFDVLEYEAKQKKRRMILQRATQRRVLNNLGEFKGNDPGEAMISLLERDGTGRSPYSNVSARQAAVRGMAHALMDNVIAQLKKTQVLGRTTRKSKATSQNMVRGNWPRPGRRHRNSCGSLSTRPEVISRSAVIGGCPRSMTTRLYARPAELSGRSLSGRSWTRRRWSASRPASR